MGGYGIVVEGLRKTYVTRRSRGLFRSERVVVEALRGVSFKVRYGEIHGLLGPNGAGKTTTVRILATLLLPDAGDAYVNGFHVVREARKVRESIGVMLSVERGFYGKLTGRENLEYFAMIYHVPRSLVKRRVEEVIDLVGLRELGAEDKLYEEYSLGMKARLSLARALLRDPPVLLLDEPTLGLDPTSARRIRELLRLLREQGKAILLTTHNMWEAEILCDTISIINKGVIIAEGTPDELKSRIRSSRTIVVEAVWDGAGLLEERVRGELGGVEFVTAKHRDELVELRVGCRRPEEVLPDVLRLVVGLGARVVRVRVEEPSLEDVFIELTGGAGC